MISFLKKETLLNISSFKVSSQNLAFVREDILYLNYQEITNGTNSYFLHNDILYFHKNSKTYGVNQDYEKIMLAEFSFNFESLYEGTIMVGTDIKAENLSTFEISCKYKIISISDFSIIRELPHRYSHVFGCRYKNSYLCSEVTKTLLRSLSLLTGEYEWEVDLGGRQYLNAANEPMEAEIQQIIGIWENQLLVSLSNQTLVGIDINKGTILWEKCPWSAYPSLSGGLANPILEKDSVFWYSYGAYFEFHLPSLRGKLLKEYPHTDKSTPPFAIKQAVFTEKYIYFIASQKSVILNNIVGVFNRETLQIDWQEELDILPKKSSDPYNSLLQIQATEDKIYVLDSGGTLHIFEREG
jgi:hypothetical protein